MNNDNKLLINAFFWKFAERIGAQLVSVVVSIILARLIAPSEYGIIPLVMVFITIANIFVDSGFGSALVQKKDADNIDFSTVLFFSFSFSVLLYFIVFLVAKPISNFYNMPILCPVIRTISVTVIFKAINSVQQAYVYRKMIFQKFFYATIIGTITSGIVGVIMAYCGCGVWALVFQVLINSIMDTIILQLLIDWKPIMVFSFERLKVLFAYGWKILIQGFVLQLYANLRSLIIGKIYTPEDLAFYTKGNQFPDLISTNVDTSISTALFPTMAKKQDDIQIVKEIARRTTQITSFIMNPILIGLAIIADTFIELVIGTNWLPAVPYLRICCAILVFRAPQTAIFQGIKAVGRSDSALIMDLPVRIFALAILIFSINYSVLFFAFSEILVTVFGTIFYAKMAKKILNYSFKEVCIDFMINTALSVVMGGFVVGIGFIICINGWVKLLIQIISGFTIYILLSIVTENKNYYQVKKMIFTLFRGAKA